MRSRSTSSKSSACIAIAISFAGPRRHPPMGAANIAPRIIESAGRASLNEDGPKFVDIGSGRAGDEQVANGVECRPGIVVAEHFGRDEPGLTKTGNRAAVGKGAGIVLAAVDAIRFG